MSQDNCQLCRFVPQFSILLHSIIVHSDDKPYSVPYVIYIKYSVSIKSLNVLFSFFQDFPVILSPTFFHKKYRKACHFLQPPTNYFFFFCISVNLNINLRTINILQYLVPTLHTFGGISFISLGFKFLSVILHSCIYRWSSYH